ncbi:MAG: alkaline phosphatase D family protein [Chlorogloeopsis fritschii C42_A2020_084]|uniref:alkaline phosphatase D family protein n=1 Tax=Chlorogloeopsis fritschii TaxID=1124 RepID=UPI0019FAB722|nr:alkaline phosphatase D family protein [Chlorogloeopsis fritschii]MBF2005384.1 alkaline phosphatase D family protein [Chlorogloeopsis fritschii C42_A2020_084]
MKTRLNRRLFLALSTISASLILGSKWLEPAFARFSFGQSDPVQSGDVTDTSATIWARNNDEKNAHLVVKISKSPNFQGAVQIIRGSLVSTATDYTGKVNITGLRPNQTYYYRVFWEYSLFRIRSGGTGSFRTAPAPEQARPVRFVWGADLAGQGWGRNPNLEITAYDGDVIRGGYVIFDVMRKFKPDFAIFAGDIIYADNEIPSEKEIPAEVGGGKWINNPTKDFKAITIEEFRENWKYNLGDDKLRHFLAETPIYSQWDDHEAVNNWYPGEILTEAPYNGLSADVLAATAKQALFEYNPIRGDKIYRRYQYGKHLDLFLLDERSYRGPNPDNSNPNGLEMLGQEQFEWLKQSLKNSQATWKVISSHDPLSIVTGGEGDRDAWGQGLPEVLGREVQLSQLLQFIKSQDIKNVVFITADVHYPAAISYEPARAFFKDFNPFWEFVIGPIHAGAFGSNDLDPSFGPKYEFIQAPGTQTPKLPQNSPPPNVHSFGSVEVNAQGELTVYIHDITGKVLYKKVLNPER